MDIRKLDLNLLLTLDVLFEEKSVSAAAKRLGTSQPTVSFNLGKARTYFGDELFVRTKAGIKPTPFATKMRSAINHVIETIQGDILQPLSFDPAATQRRFVIAGYDVGALASLPPILETLRKKAPHATMRWLSSPDRELRDFMENGRVDLVLGHYPNLEGPGVHVEKLFLHPFVCMVRKGHPTIDGSVTLEQFLAADHLEVSRDDIGAPLPEKVMAALGYKRRVLLHTEEFLAVPNLIASSDMVSTVPLVLALACKHRTDIQILPLPIESPLMQVSVYWHRRMHNDPSIIWLRELVIDLFRDHDPARDAFQEFASAPKTSNPGKAVARRKKA